MQSVFLFLGSGEQGYGWGVASWSCVPNSKSWTTSVSVSGMVYRWSDIVRWLFWQHHQGLAGVCLCTL